MVTILETEILQQRLTTATALPTVLDASWDIFNFIQQVTSEFSGPDGGWAFTQAGRRRGAGATHSPQPGPRSTTRAATGCRCASSTARTVPRTCSPHSPDWCGAD